MLACCQRYILGRLSRHVCWRWVEEQVLRFDVAMDQIPPTQVFQSTGDLFEEVASENLVKASNLGIGVLSEDVGGLRPVRQGGALLHKLRQIRELTVLHDKIEVDRFFDKTEHCNDVGMLEALQDADLGVEVLFELLGKL